MSKTKKKTGRPAKPVKKDIRASIRFTKSEYFIVRQKATSAGLTPSHYLRQLAIYATVTPRLTDEQREMLRHLIGMSNNVNQIAKICHQEGALRAMAYFETFRTILDNLLQKFKS